MIVSIIAALDENDVIGQYDKLPWHQGADLARFKDRTMGHHVIMGRVTWFSLPRPLIGRHNIVLTGNPRYRQHIPDEVRMMTSLDAALRHAECQGETECFLAGGAEVYALGMAYADRMYLTRVHTEVKGEKRVKFPEVRPSEWELRQSAGPYAADAQNQHAYTFYEYHTTNYRDAGVEANNQRWAKKINGGSNGTR